MRRNCNLELRLVTPSLADYNNGNINPPMAMDAAMIDNEEEAGSGISRQKLTIFYNGRIVTYHVTQCQARDIISLANQEMLGEKINHSPTTSDDDKSSPTVTTSPVFSPNTALCMNKSLQRFLEKRKARAQATSPY